MKYSEITEYPRQWNKDTHPVVGHVVIQASRFDALERRVADQTQARLLGHDETYDGLLVVHVAFVDEEARRYFAERWSA